MAPRFKTLLNAALLLGALLGSMQTMAAEPVAKTPANDGMPPVTLEEPVAKAEISEKEAPKEIDYSAKDEMKVTDESPLIKAIMAKDEPAVRAAIAAGAKVNELTTDGTYPVMVAVQHAPVAILTILTGNGASVQVQDKWKRNPMHYAAIVGDSQKITMLSALNVSVAALDVNGISPLYYALYNKHLDAATVLKDVAKADVNQLGPDGELLAFGLIAYKDRPDVAKWLVENGLYVFKQNSKEKTLMQVAKKAGHKESEAILKAGFDTTVRNYIEEQKKLEAEKNKANE